MARSLREIDIAYGKSKERLEKDLNKMEYHVTQIKDTRERIGIKHIKSLDIVQREINKIMPNDLTGRTDMAGRQEVNSDLEMEAIRNDLESEDVFSIAFGGKIQLEDSSMPLSMLNGCNEKAEELEMDNKWQSSSSGRSSGEP
jgi:hypothetical protein